MNKPYGMKIYKGILDHFKENLSDISELQTIRAFNQSD